MLGIIVNGLHFKVSVERIREYQEGGLDRETKEGAWPSDGEWPTKGHIEFREYSVSEKKHFLSFVLIFFVTVLGR